MNSPVHVPANRPPIVFLLCTLLLLAGLIGLVAWSTPPASALQLEPLSTLPTIPTLPTTAPLPDAIACDAELPQIEYLGEGAGRYTLGEEFETFIVKQRPFTFALDAGELNQAGETIYRARNHERVWRCQGDCELPALHEEAFTLGYFEAGATLSLVIIDDDGAAQGGDERYNWWALNDPLVPYTLVEAQEMVEYLTFQVPAAGNWYYYAADSLGIAATCSVAPQPTVPPVLTATPTPTPENTSVPPTAPTLPTVPTTGPTDVPTTATPTGTEVAPTATATAVGATPTSPGEATPTATSTLEDEATPTATLINTVPPPVTPTATATFVPTTTPSQRTTLYIGAAESGTIDGIAFADEDILALDIDTATWSLFLDGSDIALTTAMNDFYLEEDGTILFSFSIPVTLPGIGEVDRSDIVRFAPITLGETTSGTFSLLLDGSDVGLESPSESIDTLARLPDGRLVVSTGGNVTVADAANNAVNGERQDLLVFNAIQLGETSAGSWEIYFDGSDVMLTTNEENLADAWIDPATGNLYLTTYLDYAVSSINALSGDSDDIFRCLPDTLGDTTACTFSLFWDGDSFGFDYIVSSFAIDGTVPAAIIGTVQEERQERLLGETNRVYLPLIER